MSIKIRKKFRKSIIIVMILLCMSIILYSFILYYPNMQGKKLLKNNKWNILNGGKSNEDSIILSKEYLNREITKMQIEASLKIGLDPREYEGKSIVKFYYSLKQTGIDDPLRAEMWIYKNKIICAYIMHAENNIKMKYWSLNADHQVIISDLNRLK